MRWRVGLQFLAIVIGMLLVYLLACMIGLLLTATMHSLRGGAWRTDN